MAMIAKSETPIPTAMAMPVKSLKKKLTHSYGHDCQE